MFALTKIDVSWSPKLKQNCLIKDNSNWQPSLLVFQKKRSPTPSLMSTALSGFGEILHMILSHQSLKSITDI